MQFLKISPKQDFDDDGTSECIGFSVTEISVFTTAESDVNLLTGNFSVPEDFLKKFSRYNFDGFCLGVLFTNRAFTGTGPLINDVTQLRLGFLGSQLLYVRFKDGS